MPEPPAAGFLPVDKPAGPTSHDIVAIARRVLRERRIGHTGTLDPFASGLLLLAVGRATRLAEYLADLPKTYLAVLRLGTSTDTDDRTGAVVSRSDEWRRLPQERIREALAARLGTSHQVPPTFSAKKVAGQRLYALARQGRAVAAEASEITVHSIVVTAMEGPDVVFEITCSTGTYIRAIARDTGNDLGVGAHLVELRRTAIGPHHVRDALALEAVEDPAAVARAWIPPAAALGHLPAIAVDEAQAAALSHGRSIAVPSDTGAGVTAAIEDGELVAVGEVRGGSLRPRKVFAG